MKLAAFYLIWSALLGSALAVNPFDGQPNLTATYDPDKPLEGTWTMQDKKVFLIQHHSGGKFFSSRIPLKSKIITQHSCGMYSADGETLSKSAKFATADWIESTRKDPDRRTLHIDGINSFTTKFQRWNESWTRMSPANIFGPLDGLWQKKITLTVHGFKAYSEGRVFYTETDIRSKKVKGSLMGTYEVRGNTVTETCFFATEEWKEKIGHSKTWTIDIKDGVCWLSTPGAVSENWTALPVSKALE